MTDTVITSFCGGTPHTNTIYYGKILECIEKRINQKRYQFAVTDVLIYNAKGYRLLSVALPAGLLLYEYIHTCGRCNRMDAITFEFKVVEEIQRIIGFVGHDAGEWIGNTLGA